MSKLKTRMTSDGRLGFWCVGCDEVHAVPLDRWKWNGDRERPTLTPSILVTSGHFCQGFAQGEGCWCTYNAERPGNPAPFKCGICHTFLTDGQIQYLADCTHEYAGKTIDLIPFGHDE